MTLASLVVQAGQQIMGKTADEIYQLSQGEDGEAEFQKVFASRVLQEVIATCKCKYETWQDETRLKCIMQQAHPVTYASETARMLDEILSLIHI